MSIYTVTLNPALDRALTVPDIRFDTVLRSTGLHIDYGGKGFNVSRALAALGKASTALGWLGGDTGHRIAQGIQDLGVAIDMVEVSGETRTNVSITSETPGPHLKVNEPGPIITPQEQQALLDRITALVQPGDWWVLSGSLPRGVPDNVYTDITRRVQSAGARVLLDASGPALKQGCGADPYLIKPNAHEAAELTGLPLSQPEDAFDVVTTIHRLGVTIVMITFGKAGALLSDGAELWLAQAPAIVEQNPTGAGDAALAGLLWAMTENLAWPEALRWSVATGSAAASLAGTAFGDYDAVSHYASQVKVSTVPT